MSDRSADRDVAVAVHDVSVAYRIPGRRNRDGGARSFVAVRNVAFEAVEGETIGVIGRNGSGKSSLLRAIAGLMPVASGEILANATPVLLGVGAALKGDLTGRQNILLGGTALGLSRAEVNDQMDQIIEFSGLGDSIDRLFRTYSSGMKARLQFAVSTAVQPHILLVDEALSVGDEDFKERSNDRIQELVRNAGTVFLVSHSLRTIQERCDRVLWLDTGTQRMWGAAGDVVTAYQFEIEQRRARRRAQKVGVASAVLDARQAANP
jgi:teichoic acid transport system ATP-binding protein